MEQIPKFNELSDEDRSRLHDITIEAALCLIDEIYSRDDLPEEFKDLFYKKFNFRLYRFFSIAKYLEINQQNFQLFSTFLKIGNEGLEIAKKLGEFAYQEFNEQIESYKKEKNEAMRETLLKAKSGQNSAIYKLVEWDKTWLTMNSINAHIISKQDIGDTVFFGKLADAIRKKLVAKVKPRSIESSGILFLVKLLMTRYNFRNEDDFKSLHQLLDNTGFFDGESEILPLSEYKYFKRYLKRHRIIK